MVGATRLGFAVRPVKGDALYILAEHGSIPTDGQADQDSASIDPAMISDSRFVVVQSAYESPLTERADVVLPARAKFEMKGHILNIEGRRLSVSQSVEGPGGVMPDWTTLFLLSVKMGQPLGCMTVTDFAAQE